eukprot:TRINITY_DN1399_c0_g1_i1.p1 TRINITY_DN1399_c0_g1~~TRINITY_DN1399_c0_g1_i1.p1  ORF type:complete len:2777 (+),score=613.10 TRINITY_DN1399_c0_g1_i1:42-8372(+)
MLKRESVGDDAGEAELENLLNDYCMDTTPMDTAPIDSTQNASQTAREGSPIREAQFITEGLLEKLEMEKANEEQMKVIMNEKLRKELTEGNEATLRDTLANHFNVLNLKYMVEDYPELTKKYTALQKEFENIVNENRALKAEARVRERSLQLAMDGSLEETTNDRLRAFREKAGKSAPPLKGKLAIELEKIQQELEESIAANNELKGEVSKLAALAENATSLDVQLGTAKVQIQKMQLANDAVTKRAREAEEEVEKLEVKADESEAISIEAIRKEEKAQVLVKDWEAKVTASEQKLAQWLHEHIPEIELRRTNAELTEELESRERKISALTAELSTSVETATTLRVDIKASNSKIDIIEEELSNLGTRLEEATSILATKDQETANLLSQLKGATQEAQHTKAIAEDLHIANMELEDAKAACKKMQERAETTEALEAQNLRLQEEHAAIERKLDVLSTRLGLKEVERVLKEENLKLNAALQAEQPARVAMQEAVQSLSDVHEELKKQAMQPEVLTVTAHAETQTNTPLLNDAAVQAAQAVDPKSPSIDESLRAPSPLRLGENFLGSPVIRKRSSTFTSSPSATPKMAGPNTQLDWYELHNAHENILTKLAELTEAIELLKADDELATGLGDASEAMELLVREKERTEAELQNVNKKLLRAVRNRRNHLAHIRVEDDILAAIQTQIGKSKEAASTSLVNINECLVSITLESCTFLSPSSYIVLHAAGQQYKASIGSFTEEAFVLRFERSQILRLEVWDTLDNILGVAEVPITAAAAESEEVSLEIQDMPGELRVGLTNAICKYGSPLRDRTSPMMWLEQQTPEQVDVFTSKLVERCVLKHAEDFQLLHTVPFDAFVVFRLVGEAANSIDGFMKLSTDAKLVLRCGLGLPPVSVMCKDDIVADHADLHSAPVPISPLPEPMPSFESTGDEWTPVHCGEKSTQTDIVHPLTTALEESKTLLDSIDKMTTRLENEGLGCGDLDYDQSVSDALKRALEGVELLYRQASHDASVPRERRKVQKTIPPASTALALLTGSNNLIRCRAWMKLLRLRHRKQRGRKVASYLENRMSEHRNRALLHKYYSALESCMSCADEITLPVKTRLQRALRRESVCAAPQQAMLELPEGKMLIELSLSSVKGADTSEKVSLHCPPNSKYGRAIATDAPLTLHAHCEKPTHVRWTLHGKDTTSAYMVINPASLPSIQQLTTDTRCTNVCFLTVEAKVVQYETQLTEKVVMHPIDGHPASLADDMTLSPTLRLDRALRREQLRERCIDLTVVKITGSDYCVIDVDGRSFKLQECRSVTLPFGTGYSTMRLSTPKHQGVTTSLSTADLSKPISVRLMPSAEVILFASLRTEDGCLYQHEVVDTKNSLSTAMSPDSHSSASPDEFDASEEASRHAELQSFETQAETAQGLLQFSPEAESGDVSLQNMSQYSQPPGDFTPQTGEFTPQAGLSLQGSQSSQPGEVCDSSAHTVKIVKSPNSSALESSTFALTTPAFSITVLALLGAERDHIYSVGLAVDDAEMQKTETASTDELKAIFNTRLHFFSVTQGTVLRLLARLVDESTGEVSMATTCLVSAFLPTDVFHMNIKDKQLRFTFDNEKSMKKGKVVSILSGAPGGWLNDGLMVSNGELVCSNGGVLHHSSIQRPRPPAVMTSPSQSSLSCDDESAASPINPVDGEPEPPLLKRLGTRKERKQKMLAIRRVDSTPLSQESLLDILGEAGMMRGPSPYDGPMMLDSPGGSVQDDKEDKEDKEDKQDMLGGSTNSVGSARSGFSSPPRRAPRKMLTISPSQRPMSKEGSLYEKYLEQVKYEQMLAKQREEAERMKNEEEEELSDEECDPYPACVYKQPEPPEPPSWHPYVMYLREEDTSCVQHSSASSAASSPASNVVECQDTCHDLAMTITNDEITAKLLVTVCYGRGLPESATHVAVSLDGRGTQYTSQSKQTIWNETFAYPVSEPHHKKVMILDVCSYTGCIGQVAVVIDLMKFPKDDLVVKLGSRLGHSDPAAGAELVISLGLDEQKQEGSPERWSPERHAIPRLQRGDRHSYVSTVGTVLSSERLSTLHLSHTSLGSDIQHPKASSTEISDVSSETLSPCTTQSPTILPTVPPLFTCARPKSESHGRIVIEVGETRKQPHGSAVQVRDEACGPSFGVAATSSQTDANMTNTLERSTSPLAGPVLKQMGMFSAVNRSRTPAPATAEAGVQEVPETATASTCCVAHTTSDKDTHTDSANTADASTGMSALEVLGMDFTEADPRVNLPHSSKVFKRNIGCNTDKELGPPKDLLELAKAQKEEAVQSADRLLDLLKKAQNSESTLKQSNNALMVENTNLQAQVSQTENVAEDILKELKESRDEVEVLLQKKCVNCDRLLRDLETCDLELRQCKEQLEERDIPLSSVLEKLEEAEAELNELRESKTDLGKALRVYELAKGNLPSALSSSLALTAVDELLQQRQKGAPLDPDGSLADNMLEEEWKKASVNEDQMSARDRAADILAELVLQDPILRMRCESGARDEFEVILQRERRQQQQQQQQVAERAELKRPMRYPSPPVTVTMDLPIEEYKQQDFVQQIMDEAGLPAEDVEVLDVRKGSTIVTFRVFRDTKEEAEELGCRLATKFADPDCELSVATKATDVDIGDPYEEGVGWHTDKLGWLLETRGRLVSDIYGTFCCLLLGGDNVVKAALMLDRILNTYLTEVERLHLGLSAVATTSRVTEAQLSRLMAHSPANSPTRLSFCSAQEVPLLDNAPGRRQSDPGSIGSFSLSPPRTDDGVAVSPDSGPET